MRRLVILLIPFICLAEPSEVFVVNPVKSVITTPASGTTQTVSGVVGAVIQDSLGNQATISSNVYSGNFEMLVKATLSGMDEDNTFHNVAVTQDGNLAISDNSSGLSIAQGNVTGVSYIHKFGNAPDFDTGDGGVSIWDGANDGGLDEMSYTYSDSANIDSIISTSGSDTGDIEIQGLNSGYTQVVQTVTLTGQTRAEIPIPLIRVFRLKNVGSSDFVGQVSCYITNSPTSSGVVTASEDVRAQVDNGNNQTLMAIYTIPAGKTGYLRSWYAATAGAGRGSSYIVQLFARPFGQVFQLKHKSAVSDTGTSAYVHDYIDPEVFSEKTDIEMRVTMTANGGTGASVSAGFDIVLVDN